LIDAKLLSFLEDTYPEEYRRWEESGKFAKDLFDRGIDKFIIEQGRAIGLRILFNPKVLLTLYHWTLHPDVGRQR